MNLVRLLLPAFLLVTLRAEAAKIVLVAGTKGPGAALRSPFGIEFDREGAIYVPEMTSNTVCRIDAAGNLSRVAGTGAKGFGGDGGPAVQAQLNGPHNVAWAGGGELYIADTWNSRVRRLEVGSGRIATVAGTGRTGFSGDGGPALAADFGNVYCVSLDPRLENLFLADLDNRRIRAVNLKTGLVRTVAGNGEKGVPADGALATEAPLVDPRAVAVDAAGNIYILERNGHALRVVDGAGKIRTVAGNGRKGLSGDGGEARAATLSGPKHLCVDAAGNVIIADTDNHVIRKYLPREGRIVRVAGSGKKGANGLGGDALEAELNQPHGVHVRPDGTLYICDSGNDRILRIEK
jgi:DNA-binding beta-propeller fold protein YncE